MLIDNKYNDATFFIAHLKFSNGREFKKIVCATDMAATLTDHNLPEHFSTTKEYVQKIQIVQAFSQIENPYLKETPYQNKILTVTTQNLVSQPTVEYTPVFILQAIAFDRLVTDCFYVKTLSEAEEKFKEGCRTAYNFNVIVTRIIKNITF